MRRAIALACVGWVTVCEGYRLGPDPLAAGMSAQDAANSLRADLIPVTRASDADVYVAQRPANIPGFGAVTARTLLQFRDGRLFGWTSGWRGR